MNVINIWSILQQAIFGVVYLVCLLLVLTWPAGRAKVFFAVSLGIQSALSMAWTCTTLAMNMGVLQPPDLLWTAVYGLTAAGGLLALAMLLVFVLVMRSELYETRHKLEDRADNPYGQEAPKGPPM